MNKEKLTQISKYISLILRHKPEVAGITLDEHGWADVYELIVGVSNKYPHFTGGILKLIVDTDEKQRYSFNEDHTKIRANQGHSVDVDVELEAKKPPVWLYHGTAKKYVESIAKEGLKPKSRLYVHLSSDGDTAVKVGQRHGAPVVCMVNAEAMWNDGYEFFLSKNGVWLTKEVPVQYIYMTKWRGKDERKETT